jgi:hypothetical protein
VIVQELKDENFDAPASDGNLDAPASWEMTWLAEFLEDLFWIIAADDGSLQTALKAGSSLAANLTIQAIHMQANALLTAYYPNQDVGDIDHPPPALRVLASTAYVSGGDKTYIKQIIEQLSGVELLNLQIESPDVELAIAIADFCRQLLEAQGETPWLYGLEVDDIEREVVRVVLQPSVNTADLKAKIIPGLGAQAAMSDDDFIKAFQALQVSYEDFIDEINKTEDVKSLLDLEYTSDDEWPSCSFCF